MPNGELKTKKDIEDFVRGVTILGTGGGGDPKKGMALLFKDLENNKRLIWKDLDEIDAEWSACPFLMGSIAPETEEIVKKKIALGFNKKVVENPLVNAIEELEKYLNKKAEVIVPVELGGGNTPGPLDVATKMNKILVDGDYSGRAIPEIVQIAPNIFDKKVTPITAVDEYGDVTIIKDAINNAVAERIGKLISEGAYGLAGEAGIFLEVKELKKVLIRDTLTKSFNLGSAVRKARENNKNPIDAIINELNGYLLFEGILVEKKWEDKEGYMWGSHSFKGIEKFKDQKFKIWFKNENHISWLNDEPFVTSPDLIMVVRRKDGEPITNTLLREGEEVSVIGKKATDIFRSPKGLEVLGPKHFGFDYEYVPVEKLMEE
ncbi:MAG: DUF917 domain-containing protein [Candidatus Micrarchaeia archaeon]